MLHEFVDVGGVGVHFVAGEGLRGAAMTAPVMGNHAAPSCQEENDLGVPVVGGQRPSVVEDRRLAGTPVLEVDVRAVSCRDVAHGNDLQRITPFVSARFHYSLVATESDIYSQS